MILMLITLTLELVVYLLSLAKYTMSQKTPGDQNFGAW